MVAPLSPREMEWRSLQPLLQTHGYMLRARYHPDWTPSPHIDLNIYDPEDYPRGCLFTDNVMDGFRMSDGSDVVIKHIKDNKNEVDIARYLASDALRDDIHNHTVPILDIITLDSDNSDAVLLVMRQLQPFPKVPFETVEQMVDLIRQAIEGLAFLHDHGITHGWPSLGNFLMDGARFFPNGYGIQFSPSTPMQLVRRFEDTRSRSSGGPVNYYWVNYHQSKRYEGKNRSDTVRDCFARDVGLLGTSIKMLLTIRYDVLQFLNPLISEMTGKENCRRPSARAALGRLDELWSSAGLLHPFYPPRFLIYPDAGAPKVFYLYYNTVDFIRASYCAVRRYMVLRKFRYRTRRSRGKWDSYVESLAEGLFIG